MPNTQSKSGRHPYNYRSSTTTAPPAKNAAAQPASCILIPSFVALAAVAEEEVVLVPVLVVLAPVIVEELVVLEVEHEEL